MSDNPFAKKTKKAAPAAAAAAPVVHAGEFESSHQAADSLLAAYGTKEIDSVRARVNAWIGGDSERASNVTLEYYSKCNSDGVPRRAKSSH